MTAVQGRYTAGLQPALFDLLGAAGIDGEVESSSPINERGPASVRTDANVAQSQADPGPGGQRKPLDLNIQPEYSRRAVEPFKQTGRTRGKCDCAVCAYCGTDLTGGRKHEHDHFPLPYRFGGDTVIPACDDCHRMKDRIDFRSWRDSDQWAVVMAVASTAEHPAVRVFVAKVMAELLDATEQIRVQDERIRELEGRAA